MVLAQSAQLWKMLEDSGLLEGESLPVLPHARGEIVDDETAILSAASADRFRRDAHLDVAGDRRTRDQRQHDADAGHQGVTEPFGIGLGAKEHGGRGDSDDHLDRGPDEARGGGVEGELRRGIGDSGKGDEGRDHDGHDPAPTAERQQHARERRGRADGEPGGDLCALRRHVAGLGAESDQPDRHRGLTENGDADGGRDEEDGEGDSYGVGHGAAR